MQTPIPEPCPQSADAAPGALECPPSEAQQALAELVDQLLLLGIPDWGGAEGLCLARAKAVLEGAEWRSPGERLKGTFGAWGEHSDHPRRDWQFEVANDDTSLGYWEWVDHRLEAEGPDASDPRA